MSVRLCDREVAVRDDAGESRIVDGGIYSLEGDARAETRLKGAEEGCVRLRVPEGAALCIRQRETTRRRHHGDGTACAVEALAGDPSQLCHLVRFEPNQRGHGV